MTTHKKKAIVYARVSTTKQSEEGTSLDTQAEACEKKAREMGYQIERVIKEVYTGADLFERPQLNFARADIRAGKVDALIIYAIDRLSRNIAHLAIIDEECSRARAQLIFVQDDIDNSAEGKLLLSVRGYVAEVERLKIRERSMCGRRAKLLNGIPVITGGTLYGYTPDREGKKYLINESQAATVKQIFDLAEQGFGCSSIARKLNEQNLPTNRGAFWSIGQVYKILTNEAYAGVEYANKYKKADSGKIVKRSRSEWLRLPSGTRPPIIDPVQFERVSQKRPRNTGDAMRNRTKPVLLRGLVICDICGSRMYTNVKRGPYNTYIRFRCGRRNAQDQKTCPNSLPFESVLNRAVIAHLKEFLAEPDIAETYYQKYVDNHQQEHIHSEIETTTKLLQKTERGLQRLITTFRNADDILAQAIEREIYQATHEKEVLEKTLLVLKDRQAKTGVQQEDFDAFKNTVEELKESLDTLEVEELHKHLRNLCLKAFVNRRELRVEISPFAV